MMSYPTFVSIEELMESFARWDSGARPTEADRQAWPGLCETVDACITSVRKCDHCGYRGEWSRSWVWWGSDREFEYDGRRLEFCCSRCRDQEDPVTVWQRKYGEGLRKFERRGLASYPRRQQRRKT